MTRNPDGSRRFTPAWQAVRAARAARRAADPQVQARARQHAEREARQAAKRKDDAA